MCDTDFQLKTTVAFMVFNRPDTTQRVFEEIRRVRTPRLLVIADGPRADKPDDFDNCQAVRQIIETVDWPCQVIKNYSDVNLGCKVRIFSGLDWVFEQVEEAIILEDDCLPNIDFFKFCESNLSTYRTDTRIMMISGTNFIGKWFKGDASYHFSILGGIWGWASWRRAWQLNDPQISYWKNSHVRNLVRLLFDNKRFYSARSQAYQLVMDGKIDTWDFQWGLSRLVNSGLSIVPAVNLIANIGFNDDATHTTDSMSPLASLKTYNIQYPLVHPDFVMADKSYDQELIKHLSKRASIVQILKILFKKLRRNI